MYDSRVVNYDHRAFIRLATGRSRCKPCSKPGYILPVGKAVYWRPRWGSMRTMANLIRALRL